MDPFTLTLAGVGLMSSIAGTFMSTSAAEEQAQSNRRITGLEMQVEAKRRERMELDAQRMKMEVFRNAQRARALSLATATSQGAGKGSGQQGAYGQISGQAGDNYTGIEQNLQIGRSIFDLNAQIGQQKIQSSYAASSAATGAGLSSLGNSLIGSINPLSNMFKTATGSSGMSNWGDPYSKPMSSGT